MWNRPLFLKQGGFLTKAVLTDANAKGSLRSVGISYPKKTRGILLA